MAFSFDREEKERRTQQIIKLVVAPQGIQRSYSYMHGMSSRTARGHGECEECECEHGHSSGGKGGGEASSSKRRRGPSLPGWIGCIPLILVGILSAILFWNVVTYFGHHTIIGMERTRGRSALRGPRHVSPRQNVLPPAFKISERPGGGGRGGGGEGGA